jgi:hypothetical protein
MKMLDFNIASEFIYVGSSVFNNILRCTFLILFEILHKLVCKFYTLGLESLLVLPCVYWVQYLRIDSNAFFGDL